MGGCVAVLSSRRKANGDRLRARLTVDQVEISATEPVVQGQDIPGGNEEDRRLIFALEDQDLLSVVTQDAIGDSIYGVWSETDEAANRVASFSSKTTRTSLLQEPDDGMQGLSERLRGDCIGFACKKGLKPEAPNQDSFLIFKVPGHYSVYCVFDGHGKKGHDISDFVKDNLPKILCSCPDIMSDPTMALMKAFDVTQRLIEEATNLTRIDASRSGTTCTVVLQHHQKSMLHWAHVGDSRCVVAKRDQTAATALQQWHAVELTEDHKPNLPAEKARIERNGGQVVFDGGYNYRVYARGKRYPGLNMSRAMGDLKGFHDAGISAVPDISERRINSYNYDSNKVLGGWPQTARDICGSPMHSSCSHNSSPQAMVHSDSNQSFRWDLSSGCSHSRKEEEKTTEHFEIASCTSKTSCAPSVSSRTINPASDKFVLICSDGVWEFISSDEAVLAIAAFGASQAMEAADYLCCLAWDRWMQCMRGEVVDDITCVVVFFDRSLAGNAELRQAFEASNKEPLQQTPTPKSGDNHPAPPTVPGCRPEAEASADAPGD
eukprot:TRINITY_DN26274_c0_g1_i1.p1 TRINITY_DN26274_c0_g1~~TRINITY_DN26274_c0_g1_i1.p1  ORF type:complete len:548 (-),score=126.72 TRINITY_DN26274_c0_g1_i1:230-1873(-)